MYLCMYVCIHWSMYACMDVYYMCVYSTYTYTYITYIYIYIFTCVYKLIYIYVYIYIYIRGPLQGVERVRLLPSKSTMLFKIQDQAAGQQPKQPRMTYASSNPSWMVQKLINQPSITIGANLKVRGHRLPSAGAQTLPPPLGALALN